MCESHVFESERDSENLANDIVCFLKKWGMWIDVQIFTGKKCYYSGPKGELLIRDDPNSERLLDMTFEGPLCLLLRHHEYEVCPENINKEVKNLLFSAPETPKEDPELAELMNEYLDGKIGWDPAEFDSYEEWLRLYQYCDMEEFGGEENNGNVVPEFSSREEYEDFILRNASARESKIREYFEEDLYEEPESFGSFFDDDGKIANIILNEFDDLLEKYGLWYELGYNWSLTAHRI